MFKHIFNLNKSKIYGGGVNIGIDPWPGSLVLDLADNFGQPKFINFEPPSALKWAATIDYQVLQINWPDYGVPNLPKAFWQELVAWLEFSRKDVIVCCDGGTGRTGTALSIMAGIGRLTKTDPVKFVRKIYRHNAVEANCQLRYVEKMTGIKVKCQVIDIWQNSGIFIDET